MPLAPPHVQLREEGVVVVGQPHHAAFPVLLDRHHRGAVLAGHQHPRPLAELVDVVAERPVGQRLEGNAVCEVVVGRLGPGLPRDGLLRRVRIPLVEPGPFRGEARRRNGDDGREIPQVAILPFLPELRVDQHQPLALLHALMDEIPDRLGHVVPADDAVHHEDVVARVGGELRLEHRVRHAVIVGRQ